MKRKFLIWNWWQNQMMLFFPLYPVYRSLSPSVQWSIHFVRLFVKDKEKRGNFLWKKFFKSWKFFVCFETRSHFHINDVMKVWWTLPPIVVMYRLMVRRKFCHDLFSSLQPEPIEIHRLCWNLSEKGKIIEHQGDAMMSWNRKSRERENKETKKIAKRLKNQIIMKEKTRWTEEEIKAHKFPEGSWFHNNILYC